MSRPRDGVLHAYDVYYSKHELTREVLYFRPFGKESNRGGQSGFGMVQNQM